MSTQFIYNLTDTWNNAGTVFTAIKMNVTDTASNASSALLDLQVGGVSQFKVSKAGAVTAVGVAIPTISSSDTLSNKTLASPVLSGTVSGTSTFSGATTFQNYNLVIQTTSATGTSGLRFRQSDGVQRWDWGFNDSDDSIFLNRFNSSGSYQDTPIAVDNTGAVNFKGVAVPTISSTDTLSNKTLSSPTLSGTVAGTAAFSGTLTALSATAIPAGGTAGAGLMVSSTANFGVFFGSGAPTLSAAKGSLYMRSDGSGVNDRMYVNTDGATTWTAVVTVA